MLAPDRLVELYRAHRNDTVLSIYLDSDQQDFAERGKWRVALKTRVAEQRKEADDPAAFDQAFEHLRKELEGNENGFLNGRGWVGFATPEGRLYAEGLPVPMPNLVRWESGLRVAPYARALKQWRPVLAVLVDSRRARLIRYKEGRLSERGQLEADTFLGDLTDVNVAKRASSHSGVRGQTGTDAAQRFLEVERDRLVSRVAEEVREQSAGDGTMIVVGGAERAVAALRSELDPHVKDEEIATVGLSFDMSDADIREAVEGAASKLSERRQGALLERVIESAGPNGDACLGTAGTQRALRDMRVATLMISASFRERDPDLADHFEGAAFEQGATVVEVSRSVGEELERVGEGVGAILRYAVRS